MKLRNLTALALMLVVTISCYTTIPIAYATGTSNSGNNSQEGTNTGESGGDNQEPDTPDIPDAPDPVPPNTPSCSLSSVTYTAKPISVQVTPSSSNLKVEYALISMGSTLSDRDWSTSSNNIIEVSRTGTYSLYVRAYDEETGLRSAISQQYKIYYDTTAPRSPVISYSKSNKRTEIYVDISVTSDSGSEIDRIYYRIDGGRWYSYDNDITLYDEGNYDIEAYCVDKCGNESSVTKKTITVSFKDMMELPTVRQLDRSPSPDYVRFKLDSYNTSVYDYKYKFVKKGSSAGNTDWIDCTGSTVMQINEPGEWELYIMVSYNNSSKSGSVASCIIDNVKPYILHVYSQVNGRQVSIEIDAKDSVSKTLKYSFDNGKNWSNNNKKTFQQGDAINYGTLQVKDECDNITRINYKAIISLSGNKATIDETFLYQTKPDVEIVDSARQNGYMSGYGDNKFGPDNQMTRAELSAVLSRVFRFSSLNPINSYTDVTPGFWAYDSIMSVQRLGLFNTKNSLFEPSKKVTRAEVAHAICQFVDLSQFSASNNPYTDVSNYSNHYRDDVLRVTAAGIMTGYGNKSFGPEDNLTRAQVVVIINRLIGVEDKNGGYGKTFTDMPVGHWAYQQVINATR